jgi:hypothetical protein
MEIYL